MTQLEKVLYTAKAHVTGGRDGAAKTDDGRLDVKLSSPGTAGTGTNPEQLFASGYAACFIGAMKAVGGKIGIAVPQDVSIDAEVDLGPIPNAYGIAARLNIHLPGLDEATARKLVDAARRASESRDRVRQASAAGYRFMSTMAGHEPGFEEASRALFAGDQTAFEARITAWPVDVQTHLKKILAEAFTTPAPQQP